MQSTQDFLFQRIRETLPDEASLAAAVAAVLHLSTDSVYRRIRGETPLVLEEASALCTYFNISLDRLLSVRPGAVLFYTERLHAENFSFTKYLMGIRDELKKMQQHDQLKNREIIYISKDLPIFHNFLDEALFAFHYFFWMKSILRHPDFEGRKFTPDCLTNEIRTLGREILDLYNNIPSTEVWNTECINSTIFQVEYYREAGYFKDPADACRVYDSVLHVIAHLKEQAEHGAKFLPGRYSSMLHENLQFFYNRITLGDNTIIAVAGDQILAYLNYDVINYMVTTDRQFCQDSSAEARALIRRSTMISHSGEKPRNIFFNLLASKIEDRKKNLN